MPTTSTFRINQATIRFYADHTLESLNRLMPGRRLILITDQHVYRHHRHRFAPWDTIVLRAGETFKVQATVDSMVERLIRMEADRHTVLIGVGGGVITDLVGYLASIYMRGVDVGFVPTSLLAMVDASIGGKNGIDVGRYKNLVGTIRQPQFILHDYSLLATLPAREWSNGFAEIIKHAAIGDALMFRALKRHDLSFYLQHPEALKQLIQRNVRFKFKIVRKDPTETGDRKLLNFGHTLGHALEIHYELAHGEAIALGMLFAARLSAPALDVETASALRDLLAQYGLPTEARFSGTKIIGSLRMDKKRVRDSIDFILLERLGQAIRKPIKLKLLEARLRKSL